MSSMNLGRQPRDDALQPGPQKKHTTADPLVHRGRHFGHAIYVFCNVKSLIINGLNRMVNNPDLEALTMKEQQEDRVFHALLKMCYGLGEQLLNASPEEVELIADLIQKGASGSCADDTKGMKGAIIDWITPEGQVFNPPLSRRYKSERGFRHDHTGALLCPTGIDWNIPSIKEKLRTGKMHVQGDQWPYFLYADLAYNPDDPWNGLLRNQLLVFAYKHVFTSPSSVDDDEPKATRSGNARIHDMTSVTPASLAYIATQVHFALTSASTFSRTDTVTDSERFYTSLLYMLEDEREACEVEHLITWWNRKIFPHTSPGSVLAPVEGSALDRIRQKRTEMEERLGSAGGTQST